MLKITLVLPVYNEETNLQKGVLDKIGNYIQNSNDFIEVVIVDDGSSDNSKEIIKSKYLTQFNKFLLVENDHKGKANAIITGIKKAKGEYVMFSDIDLATPIEESEKLIVPLYEGFDIVIGSRKSKRLGAPILRKIMAVGANIIRDLLINLNGIKDTQCGFKIFKTSSAKEIISKLIVYSNPKIIKGSAVSAGFDMEFLFIAKKLGYKIKEIPVSWKHVETKHVNFLKDSFDALGDIFKIRSLDLKRKYDFKK